MNKKLKIIIFLISIFLIIPNIYSTQLFTNKYIVKCDIPEKYFIQDFTCLNHNCSIRLDLTKDKKYLLLTSEKENQSIISRNNFELKQFSDNLKIIETICNNKINSEELVLFKQKANFSLIKNNDLNNNLNPSFQKLLITSYSDDNLKLFANNKKKSIINYKTCYINDFKISENWIFETIRLKNYCFISHNEVKISQIKFFLYILIHPSITTIYYFFFNICNFYNINNILCI